MNHTGSTVAVARDVEKGQKLTALSPRYQRHSQHGLWSYTKQILRSIWRSLTSGNVPDFWRRNAYQRSHPKEPRSGRQLLAPPSATQLFRLFFESIVRYGLASVGVFLISVAPVTEKGRHGKTWEVFAEVIIGIVLLGTGAVFLVYPWVWKVRRELQLRDLRLDKESHTDGEGNEEPKWESRRKNLTRADKNDLDVTQSFFGAFANMMFAILINPKPEEYAALAGCVAFSLTCAILSRRKLSAALEKASIQLRLLEHTKLVWEDAIEQVSNQYRMYGAVIFGLLAGLLSVAASIIRRALDDHNTHRFVDDMATYIGPSAFNSIALSGALVWFARSLHEQASHVAVIEADDLRIFMEAKTTEGHEQTTQGDSDEELQLLAVVAGRAIQIYDRRLVQQPKVFSPPSIIAAGSGNVHRDAIPWRIFRSSKFGGRKQGAQNGGSQDTTLGTPEHASERADSNPKSDVETGKSTATSQEGSKATERGHNEDMEKQDTSPDEGKEEKESEHIKEEEKVPGAKGERDQAAGHGHSGVVAEESSKDSEVKGRLAGEAATSTELNRDCEKKPLLLYKDSDGFRTIDEEQLGKLIKLTNINLKNADAGHLDDFYTRLYNKFIPEVGFSPLEYTVPDLDDTKPILKHIDKIKQPNCFPRSSYECMAYHLPKLKREKWLLRPTRRKMAARLRGDVADLRTWLETALPLSRYKLSTDPANARKDAIIYVNLKIGVMGCWIDDPAICIVAKVLKRCIRVWQHPVHGTGIDRKKIQFLHSRGEDSGPPLDLLLTAKHYEPWRGNESADLTTNEAKDFDYNMKPAETIERGDGFFHSLSYIIDDDYEGLEESLKVTRVQNLRENLRARGVELVKVNSEIAASVQKCLWDEYHESIKQMCAKIRNGLWDEIGVS